MSLEALLDIIRVRFSPSEGEILLRSLQQDPLVWQFVRQQEKSLPYFDSAPNELSAFSPGRIATWLIQQNSEVDLNEVIQQDAPLPDQLKQRAAQALEATFNTGLPPADLMTAGLLALTLRERRMMKGTWQDISGEILIKRNQASVQKNFPIWRTPMACLFSYCSDFDDLVNDFINAKSTPIGLLSVPIFVHAFLANALEPANLLNRLFSFTQNLPIDFQLESLKWIEVFRQSDLQKTLAKNLFQTKQNVDFFAEIFSELETFQAADGQDPLDKQIRYTLPEDINRLAAFHYHSGNYDKAAETYEKSHDLVNFIQAQTLFQALAIHKDQVTPSRWINLIHSVPNSKQARIFYVRSLIQAKDFNEAQKQLQDLPDSTEKQVLEKMMDAVVEPKTEGTPPNWDSIIKSQNDHLQPQKQSFNAQKAKYDYTKDLLTAFLNQAEPDQDPNWIDSIVKTNANNPQILTLARNIYEKTSQINPAIELASYLERFQPENIEHKRDLARLLSQAERWREAFTILQSLVKSESSNETVDLERFAEAALRTDRTDMAVSICQNILKSDSQNPKALILLGEGYMLKGDAVKAIQHMEQVVEMIPDEPDTWLTLARLWEGSGQTERAFEILNKGIIALPNEPKLLLSIGKAYFKKQAPSDALTYLKKAWEINPKDKESVLSLAQAYYQLGQYQHAWELLEPSVNNYKKDAKLAKLLGQVLVAMNEKIKAEPILFCAAEQHPEDLETVFLITELILNRVESAFEVVPSRDLDKLEQLLQQTLSYHPTQHQVKLHLADVDRLNGENQKALDTYRYLSQESRFEKSETGYWRLPYGLGQVAMALGEHEIGLAALQDASNKQPGNLLILHALAQAYLTADLHLKAHDIAKTALRLAPQEIDNILWYANFKTKNNEPQEAVKALKEALQINPERSELKLWLSKTFITMGSTQDAKETLLDLLSITPAEPFELQQAAYLFVHLNELDLAIQALDKSSRLVEPPAPSCLMDLAVIYKLRNEPKKALEVLNADETYQMQNPQLVLLQADILCDLRQYSAAFGTLKSIERFAEEQLAKPNTTQDSPLLDKFDFSYLGYLFRMGLVSRAIGEIHQAQKFLEQTLAHKPGEILYENSLREAYYIGFDFEHALQTDIEAIQVPSRENENELEYLDLICLQIESHLIQGDLESAYALADQLSAYGKKYSRLFAVKSLCASSQGKLEDASFYLSEAQKTFRENSTHVSTHAMVNVYRELMTLNAIAEAAVRIGEHQVALQYHQKAWELMNSQPLINWNYALNLTRNAESQQISETIALVNHAPGSEALSHENRTKTQNLIKNLTEFLPQEKISCLNARAISAFTGNWPLSLSADACLVSPEDAAAVILGSKDPAFVENIVEAFPESTQVLQAYGVFALRNKRKDGAAHIEKALTIDTSDPISHALLAMLSNNEPQSALQSIEAALSLWPDEPEWHALACDLLTRMGDLEKATKHISQAISNKPEDANFWEKSAEIKLHRNDLANAKDDFEKSASYQSNNPGIWIKMADINRRMGYVTEALKNIRTASSLAPDNTDIAIKEVKLLLDQKQFQEAENKAQAILQTNQNEENAYVLLAKSQSELGKFDQALDTLSKAIKNNPHKVELVLEKIKIRKSKEGVEALLPELIQMAHENPENPQVLTLLTDWLIQSNRLEQAEETAQTILRIIPDQAEVHLMLGRLQRKKGQLDQAIAHLSDAINYDPSMVEAYLELGKTYQERRDLEEAIKVFQKGTQANASDPRPYFFAGMALKECKDYANAEVMLKQAKKYAPNDANIIRQLGVITALNLINSLREAK